MSTKGQIGAISSQFIRRLIAAAEDLDDPVGMLASVELSAEADAATATQQMVEIGAFYDLIEP